MSWTHGGDATSVVTDHAGNTLPDYPVLAYDSPEGGTLVSDLTEVDGVTAIASLRTDDVGTATAGRIRRVKSTDHPLLWWSLTDSSGREVRWASVAHEVATRANSAYDLATQASSDVAVLDSTVSGLQARSDWVVNVKDHGAKGDGSTDDWQAITDAISAAEGGALNQGTVVFPPGIYIVSAPVSLPYRVVLAGPPSSPQNQPSATIKAQSDSGIDCVLASAQWLDNTSGSLSAAGVFDLGLHGNNTAAHGMVTADYGLMVQRVQVQSTTTHGFYLPSTTRDGSSLGIGTHAQRFIDCQARSVGGTGFYVEGDSQMDSFLVRLMVDGCGYGVVIDNATGWLVEGCHIYDAIHDCMTLKGCWTTRIRDNYLDGLGMHSTGDTHYGLYVSGPGPVVVDGNQVIHTDTPLDATVALHLEGTGKPLLVEASGNSLVADSDAADSTFIEQVNVGSPVGPNLLRDGTEQIFGGEACGTATVTADGNGRFMIDHPLGVTPEYVSVHPVNTDYAALPSVDDSTATQLAGYLLTGSDWSPKTNETTQISWCVKS